MWLTNTIRGGTRSLGKLAKLAPLPGKLASSLPHHPFIPATALLTLTNHPLPHNASIHSAINNQPSITTPPSLDLSHSNSLTLDVIGASINEKKVGKTVSEDACFFDDKTRVLAVFDGVGGWAEEKVDPSLFPRQLEEGLRIQVYKLNEKENELKTLRKELILNKLSEKVIADSDRKEKENRLVALLEEIKDLKNPQKLMDFAHNYARKKVEYGSSTACIAVLEPIDNDIDRLCHSSINNTPTHSRSSSAASLSSPSINTPPPSPLLSRQSNASTDSDGASTGTAILNTANLGDSGWLLYSGRHGKIIEKSEEQQHQFNMPYQLAAGKVKLSEKAKDAQIAKTTVEYGDIIILCTDGLLDNLDDKEISATVRTNYSSHLKRDELQSLADRLVGAAKKKFHQRLDTPWRRRIIEHCKKNDPKSVDHASKTYWGKEDDVCVVVAQYQVPIFDNNKTPSIDRDD